VEHRGRGPAGRQGPAGGRQVALDEQEAEAGLLRFVILERLLDLPLGLEVDAESEH
jgi:hypothetical protein